jgi:phage shock protein C
MMNEGKRLYRSRNDRMISGVAAGLGEYLGIDPTVVRLLFLLGLFAGGSSVPIYLVMMIIVPEEPLSPEDSVVEVKESEDVKE